MTLTGKFNINNFYRVLIHHCIGLLSHVTNVPLFFSVKLSIVLRIAAAESSTATGALGPPMSVLIQPGCIVANKIPVLIMSQSLAMAAVAMFKPA